MSAPAAPRSGPAVDALVLDVGDVLVDDAFPALLDAVARDSGGRPDELATRYRALSSSFWRGRVPEAALWEALAECCDAPDAALWRRRLDDLLTPRAGARHVRGWARRVPVLVLSNHRAEWIRPVLDRLGLTGAFTEIVISSEHGCAKPDREIFERLLERAPAPPERMLFVDDRDENLAAARGAGMQAVRAAGDDGWIAEVDRRLAEAGR